MWHRWQGTGSASVGPSGAPPAPAHPTCTGEGAQVPPVPSCHCCPPRDVSKVNVCIPKPVWSLSGRGSVATRSASRPPLWFRCVQLRKNVLGWFPRRLPGQRGRSAPRQGHLSQRPQLGATRATAAALRPHPHPGHSSRSPRRRGPAERLLETCHHRGGVRQNGRCRTGSRGLGMPAAAADRGGEYRTGYTRVTVPAEDPARLAVPPAPEPGDLPRARDRCSARSHARAAPAAHARTPVGGAQDEGTRG